ncbi:MAG: hypothetical protein P0116_01135 [Candidatus Nitrosocosmicus sp.]|nr:hypothetical protein [Candidatus Nitrosocosmicus sp.]
MTNNIPVLIYERIWDRKHIQNTIRFNNYINEFILLLVINIELNSFITVNKFLATSAVLAISFTTLGPTSMTMNVFATTNTANQGIGQSQSSTQLWCLYQVTAPFLM